MTDIVGSTEHASELGDRAWRDLIAQHHAVVRAALRRHRGREIDTAGDGFFATFDAPADAVGCALEIAEEVNGLGLEIRAGVHVGEVEQVGKKVGGITVPIASRMMSNADPGEVLVSSTVRDLATGSGLVFEDRGVRELKGVPGEWHVYSVTRGDTAAAEAANGPDALDTAEGEVVGAQERRAAAVRRSRARPIWQRRPRLVAAIAVVLIAVLATGGLLIWKPWQTPALAAVKENSVGIIDPGRNEVVSEIPTGTRPTAIAEEGGFAWVINSAANTVSQIDLKSKSIVGRIDVGKEPTGIAAGDGEVWVANSGERTVSIINVAAARVVDTIEVGNAPTAIAVAGPTLWVANSTDSTVVQLDLATRQLKWATPVAAGPIALAVDDQGLWVASADGAITAMNPQTRAIAAEPIRIARPTALAMDANSVWVASAAGTVTRIDRATNTVNATIDVGGSLSSIAINDDDLWVGDRDGNVARLDADDPSATPIRISTTNAVAAVAVLGHEVWLAAQASPQSHRGGTLRVVHFNPDDLPRYQTDPHADPFYNVTKLEGDGLVAYRRVGGAAGAALLPDLATSIPKATNGGLTYTFQLRPNLVYSTGSPVRASDFRRAIERSFMVNSFFQYAQGNFFFPLVSGAEACSTADWAPVESCDLSAGVETDDAAGTVTFHLSTPDPDFASKLANPVAYPVPEGISMTEFVDGTFPGTGPYVVTMVTDNEVRLGRNPNFQVWDPAVRPDGFPDEIVYTIVGSDEERVAMVENGEADFTSYGGLARSSPEVFDRIKQQYPAQWHYGSNIPSFIEMNSTMAPFDKVDVRKAVNYAIDRDRIADLNGGQTVARVTCQLLPPGFPGYLPYCPYTLEPDNGGRWKFADMVEAQRLVESSGTRGAHVELGPTWPSFNPSLDYLGTVLEELGYDVSVTKVETFHEYSAALPQERQISISGWAPDYVGASNFLGLYTCGGDPTLNYCDPEFDAAYHAALDLQQTDPAAALAAWARLDHRGVDLAVTAPIFVGGGDFVSARVGNYQSSPAYGPLFDQMWVQ